MATYKNISSIQSKPNWRATVSLGYTSGKKNVERKQGFKTKKEAEVWVTDILSKKIKVLLLQLKVMPYLRTI